MGIHNVKNLSSPSFSFYIHCQLQPLNTYTLKSSALVLDCSGEDNLLSAKIGYLYAVANACSLMQSLFSRCAYILALITTHLPPTFAALQLAM